MRELLFFDAFDTLIVEKDLKDLFSEAEVQRITASKNHSKVDVYIKSKRILSRDTVCRMEAALNNHLLSQAEGTVKIHECFQVSKDQSPVKLWHIYRDCIFDELRESSVLLYRILRDAKVTFEGERMLLELEESFLAKSKEKHLAEYLCRVYKERFSLGILVVFDYHEPEARRREPKERPDVFVLKPPLKEEAKGMQPKLHAEEKIPKAASGTYNKGRYIRKKIPLDPDIFYGRPFEGEVIPIEHIQDEIGVVVTQGQILKYEERVLRSEKILITIVITDFTDTIAAKIFVDEKEIEELRPNLKQGKCIRLTGAPQFDTFSKELVINSIRGIKTIPVFKERRKDTSEEKRVELHAHTMMSDMDAVISPVTLVKTAFEWGHSAIALTDHGVVQAFPEAAYAINPKDYKDEAEQQRAKDFKIIYGMEAYLVDDEPDQVSNAKGHIFEKREDGTYSDDDIKKMPSYHAIILCKNDIGRVNLYRMVSKSHLDYFFRRPRIPKSFLKSHREGLLIGSACEAGELFQAILFSKPDGEINRLAQFYDYYEIQPHGNNAFMLRQNEKKTFPVHSEEDLKDLNRRIVSLGEEYGKLVVATCDVHFLNPEDEIYRRIIMACKGFDDADMQAPLYLRTTEEMLLEFRYLGAKKAEEVVIANTNRIAGMIEKISPVRPDKCPPVIENSDQVLRDICYTKAKSMYGDELPKTVLDRLEHELNSIIKNGFAVMYIIAQKLVWKSNEDGYLVGSRGSVGSSFVATMAGITEVNPLAAHYYCPHCFYSDFDSDEVRQYAGSSGCDMPDKACPVCGEPLSKDGHNIPFETFLGFYGDKEPDIDLNFSGEYQSKAHDYTEVIFGQGNTFRAGTIGTLADKTAFSYVYKYYEERGIHKRRAEMERIASGCVGVRRSTGQHPGGIVVLPHGEEIHSFTPVQHPANDVNSKIVTTHFDYHKIEHNLLKLDILGHDDPTMIRMLEDLTGVDAKMIRMDDPGVLSLFESPKILGIKPEDIGGCDLGSLGLPELGTEFVMQMLRDTKPKTFSDMIRISGLSHGTDVWLNNTQTLILQGKCTLSTAICTRDDIMTYLIRMGVESGVAFKIMESVRKGKGLTDEMEEVMLANQVPDWYIWSCKQIKYMFPKAHACAYVMMAFRIAYFKINYPLAYYAAFFSIRATAFDYEKMCHGRAKLEQYIEFYKSKGNDLTQKEQDLIKDMKIVQEMYARGFEFMPIDIYRAKAYAFQIIDGKLMPSFSTIEGLGDKAADQVVEAMAGGPFLSREDFRVRCKVSNTVVELMNTLGLFGELPQSNQMNLMDFLQ